MLVVRKRQMFSWTRLLCGIFFFLAMAKVIAQSPHGQELNIRCDACHTSESWSVERDSISFDHDSTSFALEGRHMIIDCRQCHTDLEFTRAESNCTACHLDIHQQSVGDQCARCHNSSSWFVNNITELHRQTSFPLQGSHAIANCTACHTSETDLRFDPLETDCFSCHETDYEATTNPEHIKTGFSTNCIECHQVDAFDWDAEDIDHDFFPLTQGHAIYECAKCHTGVDYSKISTECITCHETDYLNSTNPSHQTIGISTSCAECHTTQPGWAPAEYKEHDPNHFPIYSGAHAGSWANCIDCHTDPNHYDVFTCITCHANPETDNDHSGVLGYSYNSTACLACTPMAIKKKRLITTIPAFHLQEHIPPQNVWPAIQMDLRGHQRPVLPATTPILIRRPIQTTTH